MILSKWKIIFIKFKEKIRVIKSFLMKNNLVLFLGGSYGSVLLRNILLSNEEKFQISSVFIIKDYYEFDQICSDFNLNFTN